MREILDITDNLMVDYQAREWCKLPYPNHPRGCPNYGKRFSCPPQAPLIKEWLGNYKKLWFVCVPFNLAEHIENMLLKHPSWSNRQARCVLYWQSRVNKELQLETQGFTEGLNADWTYCPEAMGVNVIETASKAGLPIETKPQRIVYKISLVRQ